MSCGIENKTRPVPEGVHPDKEGRASYMRARCPHPHGERLAQEIESTGGHIRGPMADVMYGVLRPYLEDRARAKVVAVGAVQEPQGDIR